MPEVAFVRTKDECCGDQFAFRVYNTTQSGFTLAVWRTDTQAGWGQELSAEWGAVLQTDADAASLPVDGNSAAEGIARSSTDGAGAPESDQSVDGSDSVKDEL